MRPNGRLSEEERQDETQQALFPANISGQSTLHKLEEMPKGRHPGEERQNDGQRSLYPTGQTNPTPSSCVVSEVDDAKPLSDKVTICEITLLSLQHFMVAASRCVLAALHISPTLCLLNNDPVRGLLLARFLALSGIVTLLQTSPLGIGLPLAYAPCLPTLGALSLAVSSTTSQCPSNIALDNMEVYQRALVIAPRLGQIQGALLITSLVTFVLAAAVRFIPFPSRPVFATTASLVGALMAIKPAVDVMAIKPAVDVTAVNWLAALIVIVVATMIALIKIRKCRLPLPLPACSARRGFHFHCLPVGAASVFLTVMGTWIACAIGTATELISESSSLSTSSNRPDRMFGPTTFLVPSICWGVPSLELDTILAVLKGSAVGMLLNWGSWTAVSAAIQSHEANGSVPGSWRGILVNGLSAILAGLIGAPAPMAAGADTAGVAFFAKLGGNRAAGLTPLRVCGVLLILISLVPSISVVVCSTPIPAAMGASLLFVASSGGAGFLYLEKVNLRAFSPRFLLGLALLGSVLLYLQIWGAASFIK